jgi:threonyl-tRNA synthetase
MLDENDHRNLGQRLDLFHFQEEAPGMAFWHPRGFLLHRLLEDAVRRHTEREGYREVRTPQLMRRSIWERSGHHQNFGSNMFELREEDRSSALKPVSCPGHLEIFRRMSPSYRALPLRISEFGLVHRNEPSGTLSGLFRLRQFTQDDGHIFCTEDQIEQEIVMFCASIRAFYARFGFDDVAIGLSTRPDQREGSDAVWTRAEHILGRGAAAAGLAYDVQKGEGAFYGPKLEFVLLDREGRRWQCGTIQLDLVLPERFDVHYVDSAGQKRRPAMLHRALFGSVERFLAVLLEHHRGALPVWLAPDQAIVMPIAEANRAYADRVLDHLCSSGVRAVLDARSEPLGKRIAEAHHLKAPCAAIVGRREAEESAVTLRFRDGAERCVPLDAAADLIRGSEA